MANRTLEQCYTHLEGIRSTRLDAARRCSRITIPALFTESGTNDTSEIPLTYDSTAAKGIAALASRMTSAILPLNGMPFFALEPDSGQIPEGADTTAFQVSLNRIVRMVMAQLATTNLRTALSESFERMLVGGQDLIEMQDDYSFSTHTLEDFVVKRKPNGEPIYFIVREWVDPEAIPESWKSLRPSRPPTDEYTAEPCYTEVSWSEEQKQWNVRKEFRGAIVEDGKTYKTTPYIWNQWKLIRKSHYCRSYIEDLEGDVMFSESIAKAVKEGSLLNSQARIGVNPNGITEVQDLQETENGEYVPARAEDIFSIQIGSQVQLQNSLAARQDIRRDLGRSFLMTSAFQRNGDRVTATEWIELSKELDQTLGGPFSQIAARLQIPIIRRTMTLMVADGKIPRELLDNIGSGKLIQMKVRTGLEALRAELETVQLDQLVAMASSSPAFAQFLDPYGILLKKVANLGMDPTGIIRSPQDIQAEQQAMMQQMAAQKAVDVAGNVVENAATRQ